MIRILPRSHISKHSLYARHARRAQRYVSAAMASDKGGIGELDRGLSLEELQESLLETIKRTKPAIWSKSRQSVDAKTKDHSRQAGEGFTESSQDLPMDLPLTQSSTAAKHAAASTQLGIDASSSRAHVQQHHVAAPTSDIIKTHSDLRRILRAEDHNQLMKVMQSIVQEPAVVASLPASTFAEIIRQLDPCDDILPQRVIYARRRPQQYKGFQTETYQLIQDVHARRRLHAGLRQGRNLSLGRISSSLSTYRALLRSARSTWDGVEALGLMKEMLACGVPLDLECYNLYFEARCWAEAWHPDERHRLRVFPYQYRMRTQAKTYRCKDGTKLESHEVGTQGIKNEITSMFSHMIHGGIVADARAYGHLMTALAKEGDIQGLEAILDKVWNVRVADLLTSSDDELTASTASKNHDSSNFLATESPLYPTSETLFLLAHAYCINSDLPTAIRVVDHFSRRFNIPIPQNVFGEFFEWSYILTTRRFNLRKTDGTQVGQLPPPTVEELWKVFVDGPYQCQATLAMYDFMIQSFNRRDSFPNLFSTIIRAWESFGTQHTRDSMESTTNDVLPDRHNTARHHSQHVSLESQSDQGLRHGLSLFRRDDKPSHQDRHTRSYPPSLISTGPNGLNGLNRLKELCNQATANSTNNLQSDTTEFSKYLGDWLYLILTNRRFFKTSELKREWQRRMLPNILELLWPYRIEDRPTRYYIETGKVMLCETFPPGSG